MPPICVRSRFSASKLVAQSGATLLYLTNLGITLACMLTFLIVGYSPLERAGTVLDTVLTGIAAPSECQLCPISPTDKPGNQSQECTADQNHHLSALGTAQERYQLVVHPPH